jgi:O-antigen ligase
VKVFDTESFGLKYFGVGRHIHSDINMIIYSTGLVGLMLFIIFFCHYLWIGNSRMDSKSKKLYYPLLFMFLFVLLPGRFIGIFTFGPLLMLLMSGIKYSNYNKPKLKLVKLKNQVNVSIIKKQLSTST